MITIEVAGRAAPQGSKIGRAVKKDGVPTGKVAMVEASKGVAPWREAVRSETQKAMGGTMPLEGALEVRINFRLPRPASAPRRVLFPIRKRDDLDKLCRAVLDGLTDGGAWGDDGQVVTLMATKRFADGSGPGCSIQITQEVP